MESNQRRLNRTATESYPSFVGGGGGGGGDWVKGWVGG